MVGTILQRASGGREEYTLVLELQPAEELLLGKSLVGLPMRVRTKLGLKGWL